MLKAKVKTGMILLKTGIRVVPDAFLQSGDKRMLSMAIPPYEKSLMAAIITIWKDKARESMLMFIQTRRKYVDV